MKLYSVFLAHLMAAFITVNSAEAQTPEKAQTNAFPAGTVWVNSDVSLQIESFKNKILVLVFSDIHSMESGYLLQELTSRYKKHPQIQFIEVIQPHPNHPLSRKNVVQYAQKNGWTHPIAVVPNFESFGVAITVVPTVAVYHLSSEASLVVGGLASKQKIHDKLSDFIADQATFGLMPFNTVIPDVSPSAWADPVIENPHRLAVDKNDHVYVIDQSHHRIVALDYFGKSQQIFGNGTADLINGYGENTAFNHPQGLAVTNGGLFVADTYNNCVRKINLSDGYVETFLGTGNFTDQKQSAIRNTRNPIGLPSDVVLWNDKLYVSSLATNEIFSVNTSNGDADLFLSFQSKSTNLIGQSIVQLAAGDKLLYLLTNDGWVYSANKKGELNAMSTEKTPWITAVCEVEGQVYAATISHQILKYDGKLWRSWTTGLKPGYANGDLTTCALHWPQDMVFYKNELLVADAENHALRTISLKEKGKVKTFPLVLTRELIREKAANSDGELVLMDTVYVGTSTSEITVLLNTQNCTIAPGGNNEVHIVPFPGFSLMQEEVKELQFKFKLDQRVKEEEVNIELYLTIEDPNFPGVYLIKRSYLNFPIVYSRDAPSLQEIVYDMHVWPY
jgi:NHL repeat